MYVPGTVCSDPHKNCIPIKAECFLVLDYVNRYSMRVYEVHPINTQTQVIQTFTTFGLH